MNWKFGEEPGLQRLVAEERERDQEEDREPEDPRREQEVRRDALVPVEERAHVSVDSLYLPWTASHFFS